MWEQRSQRRWASAAATACGEMRLRVDRDGLPEFGHEQLCIIVPAFAERLKPLGRRYDIAEELRTQNDLAKRFGEVIEMYRRYIETFMSDDMDVLNALVSYPLAYIGEGVVTMHTEFPIRPSDLMTQTGWHDTLDINYEVIGISETKAHLILKSGTRVRQDGSAIEGIRAYYAWTKTPDGWRMFAVSDVRIPA